MASRMLAAAALRLGDEVRHTGHAPRDRERLERAFTELAEEMSRRAGVPLRATHDPGPDQLPLFERPDETERS